LYAHLRRVRGRQRVRREPDSGLADGRWDSGGAGYPLAVRGLHQFARHASQAIRLLCCLRRTGHEADVGRPVTRGDLGWRAE
jgi:hypothetical protein